ncbi:hypothetical protein ECG_00882 [Echinococcus granulosus]|uniref:Expressed conserved protein n=2 Tax=Echinococcus granulosus TaxID=6210 RepID=U6IWR1_ECHGR|nr:hypothetical protein EGR_01670 [Echinococcus granulosus]EUB63588.1 hypothetical protein EGR_01670 [Echinococcus granulosus]KAH9285966.1 hypothetical protein ECG_00882 [Echinococcus granulosus]CDS16237.1 expressed conserved protein [Echinococcus granulosus]
MSQQVGSQIFPIHLEWLGGRNTFQQSNFSVRNAHICLEDMKDSDVIMPVTLVKHGDKVIFRTNNERMGKDFNLSNIVNIHVFTSDPTYAVFEISSNNGPYRFEVIHAPGNETLNQVHDFLFTRNFAYASAQILPRKENSPTSSNSDTYEAPETGQPATNGVSTPELQTEEGYEEVAVKLVDQMINGHESPSTSPEVEDPVQVKDEVASEEVGKTRSSSSTTSVSSDTNIEKIQKEDNSVVSDNWESRINHQEVNEAEAPRTIEVSRPRHFCKLRLLTNIIAEEGIDTRHYHDDGRLYVVSRIAFQSTKIRPLPTKASVTEDESVSTNDDGENFPVIRVQPVAKIPTKHRQRQSRSPVKESEKLKGKSITPERSVCKKCIGSEGKKKLRDTSPALRIRIQTPTCNVCECIRSCNKNPTSSLFCCSRRSHQPGCSTVRTLYVHNPS